MELVRVNTTLSKQILDKVDHYAEEMQEDRSTAIRQLLAKAILEGEKQNVLTLFKEKRLTIREAADFLGIDYWQMQELLEKNNVPVSDLTKVEIKERKDKIRKMK